MLLIETFIRNVKNLHTLEIVVFSNPYLNNILEIILHNIDFFHNIKNLKLSFLAWKDGTVIIETLSKVNDIRFDGCSSIILQNLGKSLSSKLEHLDLCLNIKVRDFEEFLKSIQNTFIKKLSIYSRGGDNILVLLPYLRHYIMKKKCVKYLAVISGESSYNRMDLLYLKDEVEEFELYNIEVQNYCSNKMVEARGNFVLKID
ncbi:hypothetical protein GLOIN_2v1885716 [Rhizophagus irregularis DAOM 181602=DAOM 197198]|nr:hypothetical protein GLOIN_2v1885716 [Rhizophagus irregularis DAOM 181602=DAOM 197198]